MLLGIFLATVIVSTSNASSNTGGNAGGSVSTGSANALSETSVSVGGQGSSGGTVTASATTVVNGESHTESKTETIAPGEDVDVEVASHANSSGVSKTSASISKNKQKNNPSFNQPSLIEKEGAETATASASTSVPRPAFFRSSYFIMKISSFFGKIFSIF